MAALTLFNDERWDGVRGCVEVNGKVDGREVTHRIGRTAMDDFFGTKPGGHVDKTYLTAFRQLRGELLIVFGEALKAGQTNETGGADVTTKWLSSIKFTR